MNLLGDRSIRSDEMLGVEKVVSHKTSKRNALAPCDDCPNRAGCSEAEIACPAYKVYASNQGTICSPLVWQNESRVATARIYKYIWDNKTGRGWQ